MSKPNKEPTIPFSLRLTADEHALLKQAAGQSSMATYARSRLFGDKAKVRKKRGLSPVKDREALGRVLGKLGVMEVSTNLKVIAEAARAGSLVIDPGVENALFSACEEIGALRKELMIALGLRIKDSSSSLTGNFRNCAE